MGYVADAFDSDDARRAAGHAGDRPRALLDRRREPAVERAAVPDRLRARPDRDLPQRQPGQRRASCATSWCAQGSIFQSSTDTEVVLHLYARSRARTVEEAVVDSVSQVQGAFSFVMLTRDRLIAVRDPHGFRPLALGRLGDALRGLLGNLRDGPDRRDLRARRRAGRGAGRSAPTGMRSIKPFAPAPLAHCVFEHVYFARPDSYVFGKSVNEVRTNLGRMLAREQPVDADVVVPVPDSGVCAAMGFAEESGIPLRMGLIRNHYVGRTFIEPQAAIRHFGVRVKLNPVRSILEGRRVMLVDDSIVRGTTSRKIVRMVRAAGAREVHVRISCPPTISPCFYGVDTPRRSELIAATHTLEEITQVPRRRQRRATSASTG